MEKGLSKHVPVLVDEIIEIFSDKLAHLNYQAIIIDATLGAGGHSIEFVKRGFRVLGIEQDPKMIKVAQDNFKLACPVTLSSHERGSLKIVHGNFRDLKDLAIVNSFNKVDGILFDLGLSTFHYKHDERGFSFSDAESELDMRLDVSALAVTASDLVNSLPEKVLRELFIVVMPYRSARLLAGEIVRKREISPIRKVSELVEIINQSLRTKAKNNLDLATLPFLALRIAVNSELDNLSIGLNQAVELMRPGALCAVISFHSGEDKIVKNIFKKYMLKNKVIVLTKKPIRPAKREIKINYASRSAKLRLIQKI